MLSSRQIVDGHVHLFEPGSSTQLLRDLRHTGTSQFALMVTRRGNAVGQGSSAGGDQQWASAISLKRERPEEVFLFGGLDFAGFAAGKPATPAEVQLQQLMDWGCDGLKLLNAKPDERKAMGQPLDSPLLRLAEERGFPITWHVADPPEFWSQATVPLWARQRGWWYDASHPKKAQIDAEMARVMQRHPRLKLILAHFFFLSNRLQEASELLKRHPTYALDLAPGVEMYHNFTANRDAAREFFLRFAAQIVFGSDFGMPCGWSPERGNMIRRFLETDDTFVVPDDPAMMPDNRPPLRGLKLPEDTLALIYGGNFHRLVGARPRPLAM